MAKKKEEGRDGISKRLDHVTDFYSLIFVHECRVNLICKGVLVNGVPCSSTVLALCRLLIEICIADRRRYKDNQQEDKGDNFFIHALPHPQGVS